jgi:hypothetical protein
MLTVDTVVLTREAKATTQATPAALRSTTSEPAFDHAQVVADAPGVRPCQDLG